MYGPIWLKEGTQGNQWLQASVNVQPSQAKVLQKTIHILV